MNSARSASRSGMLMPSHGSCTRFSIRRLEPQRADSGTASHLVAQHPPWRHACGRRARRPRLASCRASRTASSRPASGEAGTERTGERRACAPSMPERPAVQLEGHLPLQLRVCFGSRSLEAVYLYSMKSPGAFVPSRRQGVALKGGRPGEPWRHDRPVPCPPPDG